MDDKIGFDLKDKGFQDDLKRERQIVRAKLKEEIESGRHPRFPAGQTDWLLANYPYASSKQRDQALSAEEAKKSRQREEFEAEVDKRMGEPRAILEQHHFGKNGRQFAMEQARREEQILAFKEKQRRQLKEEEKAKKRTTEQSKAKAAKISEAQKKAAAPEQNNVVKVTVREHFNYEAGKGKALADAKMKVEKFKARQRQKQKTSQTQTQKKEQKAAKEKDSKKLEKKDIYLKDDFNKQVSISEYDEWKGKESKEQTFKQKIRADFAKSTKDKSSEIER